jgi:hypothetical protein
VAHGFVVVMLAGLPLQHNWHMLTGAGMALLLAAYVFSATPATN